MSGSGAVNASFVGAAGHTPRVSMTCKVNTMPEICSEYAHVRSTPEIGSGLICQKVPKAGLRSGKAAPTA